MNAADHEASEPILPDGQFRTAELTNAFRDVLGALKFGTTSGVFAGSQWISYGRTEISVELEKIGKIRVEIQVERLEHRDLLAAPLSKAERVVKAKELLAAGAVYQKGCSEFVCAVLGIAYSQANDLMGTSPPSVGSGPTYNDLEPGDIAGWINTTGSGHVAVYVGEDADHVFIDVREPGAKPRIKNGYYNREVFKAPF